jgi:dienelactone hydrolase
MFEYFTGNYAWNLSVALGLAMGAEMGEVDRACRPLLGQFGGDAAAQGEAWFESWMRLAEHVEAQGAADGAAGNGLSASGKRFRAATYYLLAERNMPWDDQRRLHAYRKGLHAFSTAVEDGGSPIERIDVPYEDGTLGAWLCLPPGDGPFPCVVMVNGLDDLKEMHLLMFRRAAMERGLAILFVDQEGTGEAVRLQFHAKRAESEVSAGLFLDAMAARPDIDGSRCAILGLSAGGYDAPRIAAFDGRFACAASFGGLYNLDTHRAMFLGHADQSSSEGLSDQRAHLRHVTGAETDAAAVAIYQRRTLDGILDRIDVPLLITHGENDRQVPLWHAERTIAEAVRSPSAVLRVFTLAEGGAEHCGLDNLSLQRDYVFDWLAARLAAVSRI